MGWDYLGPVLDSDIKENDIVVMLYEHKDSDCWMYLWVIINLAPSKQYQKVHVCPGGFIPGPNKPKNLDSFLYRDVVFLLDLYFLFPTADGPGLVYLDGMTCGWHYYPVLIKPWDHCVDGSNHPDINVFNLPSGGSDTSAENLKTLISSPNQTQYDQWKTSTGIIKAPLILGLSPSCSLSISYCMTTNIMHLAGNLSDLLISLWCGMIDCDPTDDIND
ncbi:hypothetical protein BS17DRAFT_797893 [Gyrodon lividus]|nr:hypothetical protein BS17DRAFT_797893 [Gyrodon lividus]